MKKLTAVLLAAMLPVAAAAQTEALVGESRQAIKAFAENLQGELKAAMRDGGPVNAIDVCHTVAPDIAQAVSDARGVDVARRSLQNRNPGNAPNDWEQAVLEEFEARKVAGEPLDSLDFAEVVETDDGREFRYMKAIPTGELCLNCHGSDIAPDVVERLDALYPEDKARGFSVGDIRGAFRIIKPL
jgi:hypothetical protein